MLVGLQCPDHRLRRHQVQLVAGESEGALTLSSRLPGDNAAQGGHEVLVVLQLLLAEFRLALSLLREPARSACQDNGT
jgi:hypothetical protein